MNNTPDSLAAQARESADALASYRSPIPYMRLAEQRLRQCADALERQAVPEVTDAMVDAYLKANDAYWKRTDQLPKPPNKWRTGTPREATRESLAAALASSPPAPAQPEGMVVVTWNHNRSRILAVTRQDGEGRVLKVIAEAPAQSEVAEPVAFRRRTFMHPNEQASSVIGGGDGWRYYKYDKADYEEHVKAAKLFTGDDAVRAETQLELLYATPPRPSPTADEKDAAMHKAWYALAMLVNIEKAEPWELELFDNTVDALCAALASQPTAQGEPLSEEVIEKLWGDFMSAKGSGYVPDFVRAIEAAHHIGRKA